MTTSPKPADLPPLDLESPFPPDDPARHEEWLLAFEADAARDLDEGDPADDVPFDEAMAQIDATIAKFMKQ